MSEKDFQSITVFTLLLKLGLPGTDLYYANWLEATRERHLFFGKQGYLHIISEFCNYSTVLTE